LRWRSVPVSDRIDPVLERDGATIFVVDAAQLDFDRCLAVLDRTEIERVRKYAEERDRRAFVASRASLRHALASTIDAEPDRIRFGVGAWGKPFVVAPNSPSGLDFSVSHSGNHALVAISSHGRVGIDIELRREVEEWDKIAAMTFGTIWAGRLGELGDVARMAHFLRSWTVAEAFAKATGLGLAGLGGVVRLEQGDGGPTDIRIKDGPSPRMGMRWGAAPIAIHSAYIASLVFETEIDAAPRTLRCRRFVLPATLQ
jgi:4'-phosphopantetheinyl transferase